MKLTCPPWRRKILHKRLRSGVTSGEKKAFTEWNTGVDSVDVIFRSRLAYVVNENSCRKTKSCLCSRKFFNHFVVGFWQPFPCSSTIFNPLRRDYPAPSGDAVQDLQFGSWIRLVNQQQSQTTPLLCVFQKKWCVSFAMLHLLWSHTCRALESLQAWRLER